MPPTVRASAGPPRSRAPCSTWCNVTGMPYRHLVMTSVSAIGRSACLLIALPVLAACGPSSGAKVDNRAADASCVAPYLNDQPPRGALPLADPDSATRSHTHHLRPLVHGYLQRHRHP